MKEILLSMKPEWYELMVSGEKIYEYRKNFPVDNVKAYIYVSNPYKAIKAIFTHQSHQLLWNMSKCKNI